jgi:antitoxin ParD1/3/4
MSRSTIHISVPGAVRRYVEDRVESSGYGSVSEYFRELIREDRQRQINLKSRATRAGVRAENQFRPLASPAARPTRAGGV